MTEKLNPEVKARWIAALRSGAYQQTHNRLTDHRGGFCCLGVLCDLYAKDRHVTSLYDLQGEQEELPGDTVCNWAGVNVCNAEVVIDGLRCLLFTHNDDGRTFAEIADAIEQQL